MPFPTSVRLAVVVLVLTALLAAYGFLHPHSQRLLTPIPGDTVAIPIATSIVLAIALAQAAAGAIANRLLRRLVVIVVMAATLHLSGEGFRGLHAMQSFSGPLTSSTERWMTMGSAHGTAISATSLQRRKGFTFAATPDAAAAAGPGRCISVRIERATDGTERIAPDMKTLTVTDVSRC